MPKKYFSLILMERSPIERQIKSLAVRKKRWICCKKPVILWLLQPEEHIINASTS